MAELDHYRLWNMPVFGDLLAMDGLMDLEGGVGWGAANLENGESAVVRQWDWLW